MSIVRARQKAVCELPTSVMCCPESIAAHERMAEKKEVLVTLERFDAIYLCRFCGYRESAQGAKLVKSFSQEGHYFNSMRVDCFDFDEGPAEATQ
jgi:hypothetical protein